MEYEHNPAAEWFLRRMPGCVRRVAHCQTRQINGTNPPEQQASFHWLWLTMIEHGIEGAGVSEEISRDGLHQAVAIWQANQLMQRDETETGE